MILSDREIRTACLNKSDDLGITPFREELVQPASYDLRVGGQAAISSKKQLIDLTNLSTKTITLPYKDIFPTIEFHGLEKAVETPYEGPYQDREVLGPEDIRAAMEREYMSRTEMMRTLEALVTMVEGLKQRINWRLPLMISLIMALFFGLAKFL